MTRLSKFITIILCLAALPLNATVINIPDDYDTIQQGINHSSDGDTVLVQPGRYVENVNFNGHNIVLGSLFLTTGNTNYINTTIINASHRLPVVTISSGENEAVISGFSITGGQAFSGAGIYCEDSSPRITSNRIFENYADDTGGGIFCDNSSALILRNLIFNNVAFRTDEVDGAGGGISCSRSHALILGNIISMNTSLFGAGMAFFNDESSAANNILYYNESITITGIGGFGGGIGLRSSNLELENNIIFGNDAITAGGGICNYDSSTIILVNSILWNNTALHEPQIYGPAEAYYSDIQSGWEGEGIIDIDPLFRDPENGDFHLMSTACGDQYDSPCIDAGNPALVDSLLDCSWGLGLERSDMGAYGGGDSATVAIDELIEKLPRQFALLQNYPNPFNASTTIRYYLPEQADVGIEIYNILGQKVATLYIGSQNSGYRSIDWRADNFPSGIYLARLRTAAKTENIKMILLK